MAFNEMSHHLNIYTFKKPTTKNNLLLFNVNNKHAPFHGRIYLLKPLFVCFLRFYKEVCTSLKA